jgi:phage FluMu protein gp41
MRRKIRHTAEQPELLPRAEMTDIPVVQAATKKPKQAKPKQEVAIAKRAGAPTKLDAISTTSVLKILADAAADPNVNPDKMRALLDLQKEIRAEEAKQDFTESFIAMRPNLPIISAMGRIIIEPKPGKRGQKTPYATFNEIHKRVTPVLSQHGFVLNFAPDALADGRLVMTATLEHRAGHAKHGRIVLPAETSGSKNNVQGVGSAISYGKRYLYVTMLNLISEASEDVDDDGQAAGKLERSAARPAEIQVLTQKQVADLRKKIEAVGATEEMFCNRFEIERLEDLPPAQLGEAKQACDAFAQRKAAAQRGDNGASSHQS